jgi:hypothetical protein
VLALSHARRQAHAAGTRVAWQAQRALADQVASFWDGVGWMDGLLLQEVVDTWGRLARLGNER